MPGAAGGALGAPLGPGAAATTRPVFFAKCRAITRSLLVIP
ncbi:hypothetical protein T261_03370 [Streptomyces lydicus]|nr:hypothetical protein T261_03370 [Streptomyces lydicus]